MSGLWWTTDLTAGTATVEIELNGRVETDVRVVIAHEGETLGSVRAVVNDRRVVLTVPLSGQDNGQGYERLLWRPQSPTLLDAWIHLEVDGVEQDVVASYLGLRSVMCVDGAFLLNDRPVVLRSVLSQGYWPESHLAAPSTDALRREAELVLGLGFNAVECTRRSRTTDSCTGRIVSVCWCGVKPPPPSPSTSARRSAR